GGVGRIASVTEKLVPVMACFYIVGCVGILIINHAAIIPALRSVFVAAFDPQAVLGGAVGITVQQAMRYGVARGLFSNEAGMGSTRTHTRWPRWKSRRIRARSRSFRYSSTPLLCSR